MSDLCGSKKRPRQRVKKIIKHANPLFDKWLREWHEEASLKDSNMKFIFHRVSSIFIEYARLINFKSTLKFMKSPGTSYNGD